MVKAELLRHTGLVELPLPLRLGIMLVRKCTRPALCLSSSSRSAPLNHKRPPCSSSLPNPLSLVHRAVLPALIHGWTLSNPPHHGTIDPDHANGQWHTGLLVCSCDPPINNAPVTATLRTPLPHPPQRRHRARSHRSHPYPRQ